MWSWYFLVLLALQITSVMWPVSCLRCYQCSSIEESCDSEDETDDWETCEDDVCVTAVGTGKSGRFVGQTATVRDCNSSLPMTPRGQPEQISDNCVRGEYDYEHDEHGIIRNDATVCRCSTDLCNSGDITADAVAQETNRTVEMSTAVTDSGSGTAATTTTTTTSATTTSGQRVNSAPSALISCLMIAVVAIRISF